MYPVNKLISIREILSPNFFVKGRTSNNAVSNSITGKDQDKKFALDPIKGDCESTAWKLSRLFSLFIPVYTKRRISRAEIISINHVFKAEFFIVQL